MATVLDVTIDELVYGEQNEKAKNQISDNELLNFFVKSQISGKDLWKSVIDLLDAYILKQGLRKW